MNRRNFLRRSGAIGLPLVGGLAGIRAASSPRLSQLLTNAAGDKVLVLIQLGGGNDGLNTLVPLDQLSALNAVRPNVVLPESSLLKIKPGASQAFHPRMTGMQRLFGDGKLSIVQSVGYPNQNRSHFRSTDIWSTASPSEVEYQTGWAARYLEDLNPGYPVDYPRPEAPHPLAVTMGNGASVTCQGTVTNVSQTLNNPNNPTLLTPGPGTPLSGDRYGEQVEYLRIAVNQTNDYAAVIQEAAAAGERAADYPEGRLAGHLREVAGMIAGGLETKVYVVTLGSFDTHARQVDNDPTQGWHADKLGELSEAIAAFQRDIDERGLTDRVLGMTYSEFGRQIASNGSQGTDHGDAAPLFVFGGCATGAVLGENPTIDSEVERGAAVPFQYDFRDVYGSVLVDWFEVSEADVRNLLYPGFQYLPVAAGCTAGVNLPVDYLSFTARGHEAHVALEWRTAEERDNKGFEIERSTDGSTYAYIAWQPAARDALTGAGYAYDDPDARAGQLYYYRLRQIDHDGTFALSTTVTARLSGSGPGELTVGLPYPNPVVDATTVKVYTPADARLSYTLFDLNGRRLLQDSQSLTGRRDNLVEIRPGRLPVGTYALRFEVGSQTVTRSIVVR